MAKKENRPTVDPLAGLAYGQSRAEREEQRKQEELRRQEEQRKQEELLRQEELRKQEEARLAQEKKAAEEAAQAQITEKQTEKQPVKEEKKSEVKQGNLANIYAEKKKKTPQARTARLQVVVTPAISERLDQLVESREIRSRNDLINFLLESYFNMLDEAQE